MREPDPIETGEAGSTEVSPLPSESSTNPADGSSPSFPVVGIGASAGGLEAFEQFFIGLPPDTGMAFVLVQHLSPPHKSILPEIIQRFTSMPVAQVTDGIPVQPNQVYVIPPGVDLALTDGHLSLLKPEAARGHRLPIDFFFRTLARDQHERAIGVVLSGSGSDGSLGVKSIKAEGGLTIAQAPETAAFDDMPRSAIATQDVDFILPPAKMGEQILKVVHHQVLPEDQDERGQPPIPTRGMQKLFFLLHARTGHDFSLYKQNTLRRRIERRMKVNLVKNLDDYAAFLQDHPQEVEALFHELLINVTNFFRDPEAYQALAEKVIRPLIPVKYASKLPLRVWIAGCSTGEEAYSVAILIQEQMDALHLECPVQIFATDIDEEAVQAARAGLYPESISEDVSDERLERFFNHEEAGYQIKKNIRDRVVFATQNVISDPPFSKVDLLCCRNVLIYLEPELQYQLFPLFHQALAPDGVLFLGNSESIGGFHTLFGNLDRKHKLFRRNEGITPARVKHKATFPAREPAFPGTPPGRPTGLATGSRLRDWTEKTLLEFHTPACVVIDERHNLLFVHGHTGKYLEPAPGENHANLLRMAREGLKTELATAIHAAITHHQTVRRPGIQVKTNGDFQPITLTVRPIDYPTEFQGFLLIVFEEEPITAPPASPTSQDGETRRRRIGELQQQLKEKDEYLRTIIEELETANQDLKSANEELQSTNEEMQSANEELETSKEELQSSNEELTTINTELQKKNEELAGVNNDMFNLLASTEIGTLFLDLDLHLRRYTPAVNRLYSFLPGDIGRPVDHIVSGLNYSRFIDDIQQVLDTLAPKSVEVQAKDGAWFLVSIKPYRTLENVIDGVVITFVDVTEQKRGDELRRMGTILRDSNDAVTVLDFRGKILAWNHGAVQMYGWEEAEALQMTYFEMIPEDHRAEAEALFSRLSRGEIVSSYETPRITRDGRRLDAWMTLTALVDDAHKPAGIATTERDITERNRTLRHLFFGNRALKALNQWYRMLHAPSQPDSLAGEACRILVEQAGYQLAWIERVETAGVALVHWCGLAENGSKQDRIPAEIMEITRGAVDRALREGQPVAVRNLPVGPAQAGSQAGALERHFGACLALPLLQENCPQGVLVIAAAEPEAFEDHEIELLGALSENVSRVLGPVWKQAGMTR